MIKNIKKPSLKTTAITATVAVLAFIFIINPVAGIVKTQIKLNETNDRPAISTPVKSDVETITTEPESETAPQTPPAPTPTAPTPTPTPTAPAYKPPVCTSEPIAHSVYNRYVNYLAYGVTQVSQQGRDGRLERCTDGVTGVWLPSHDTQLNPLHTIIDNGRGQTPLTADEKRSNYNTCQMSLINGLGGSCEHYLQ